MQNMEKRKNEGEWRKAFDEAEINPSDNVWVNIELDLEKAKGTQLKKRLIFYQLLAAASLMFSIGVGVSVYMLQDTMSSSQSPIATQRSTPNVTEKEVTPLTTSPENTSDSALPEGKTQEASHPHVLKNIQKSSALAYGSSADKGHPVASAHSFDGGILPGALADSGEDTNSMLAEGKMKLPALVIKEEIKLKLESTEKEAVVDPVLQMMARLEQREKEVGENKEEEKTKYVSEKLWTSVGFAAGSFNSVNAGVASPQPNSTLAMNKPDADEEAKASGITYSLGVNLGTRISDRWVLQGGVNYLTQSSDYTARSAVAVRSENFTSFRPQSIKELDNLNTTDGDPASPESIVSTSPYNVNNNLRYLSIPLQAGYLLVNRTFGLQLNAGLSTDVFLQNVVTAEGQNLDKTTQRLGEDSPYRSVNLSGLMGTEISYRFGQHYRIALNPGIRYPLNSIYRSAVDVKASPLTFDVGLRFRYIFH
jgi:hypothetical protein